jgi:hypothetical protein
LVIGSFVLNNHNIPLLKTTDLKKTAAEVNHRFEEESLLENKVQFNKIEEKLAYNRYAFVARNIIRESFKLLDFDNLFFQENNPRFEKSVVMYTWVWAWIFVLGLLFVNKLENKRELWWWFFIALLYYWLISGQLYIRQLLIVFPTAIIIEHGLKIVLKNKLAFILFVVVAVYSFVNVVLDMKINKDYWFENKVNNEQNY